MSSDMTRQRTEIEGAIAGRTLCDELRQAAETSGDAWAYSDEAGAGGGWRSLTWSQVRQRTLEVAAGFAALGLAPGERVALMLPNRSEHVLADLGAVHAGGVGVTLYACQYGQATPPELEAQFRAADEQVLGPVRSLLGLGEAVAVFSAAAPLPPDVAAFFAGLGMKILDVYGMTETTGAFTANTPAAFKLGTVGRPYAGMEVAIGGDGEILARGPLTTPGYLNRPDLTGDLLDPDGWLHTGDIGTIDADGFVSVTDRKKELIITAGGENIASAAVENALVAHPLIGQALAYGDRRPYVAALLTLDGEAAPGWARARGITAGSLPELASDPQVLAEVAAGVAAANQQLARVQQVKRWHLLPVAWTAETEELTPTLKLKRRVVHAKYADVIDSLYPR